MHAAGAGGDGAVALREELTLVIERRRVRLRVAVPRGGRHAAAAHGSAAGAARRLPCDARRTRPPKGLNPRVLLADCPASGCASRRSTNRRNRMPPTASNPRCTSRRGGGLRFSEVLDGAQRRARVAWRANWRRRGAEGVWPARVSAPRSIHLAATCLSAAPEGRGASCAAGPHDRAPQGSRPAAAGRRNSEPAGPPGRAFACGTSPPQSRGRRTVGSEHARNLHHRAIVICHNSL